MLPDFRIGQNIDRHVFTAACFQCFRGAARKATLGKLGGPFHKQHDSVVLHNFSNLLVGVHDDFSILCVRHGGNFRLSTSPRIVAGSC